MSGVCTVWGPDDVVVVILMGVLSLIALVLLSSVLKLALQRFL